jgi:Ca-activated chloride channel family protein
MPTHATRTGNRLLLSALLLSFAAPGCKRAKEAPAVTQEAGAAEEPLVFVAPPPPPPPPPPSAMAAKQSPRTKSRSAPESTETFDYSGDEAGGVEGGVVGSVEGGVVNGVIGGVLGGTVAGGTDVLPFGQGTSRPEPQQQREGYQDWGVNGWVETKRDAQSTFSVDVDTASYTLARRKLRDGQWPAPESVRVEEWLNFFRYDYPAPTGSAPLAVHLDAAPSPFTPGRHLLRVAVQGRDVPARERKPAHLTFLVDVSGSMQGADRLPLAQRALRLLVDRLGPRDTVALVTYAGHTSLVLPHTPATERTRILAAIDALSAGGSTAMGSGLELAYQQARAVLQPGHVSRVLVLSDGDANVGTTSHEAILQRIAREVKAGVTLTTLGFGVGNYQDARMEQLADKGNGQSLYVDSLLEARRVFETQLGGTLEVIAKDVKLQVEFDPRQVLRYRLVGYENRDIADRDFRNDAVDAGEVGAGHSVTALYELELAPGAGQGLATVRVRHKAPEGDGPTKEQAYPLDASRLAATFDAAPEGFRFAVGVMGTAERVRGSAFAVAWDWAQVEGILRGARPSHTGAGAQEELLSLLGKVRALEGSRERPVADRSGAPGR